MKDIDRLEHENRGLEARVKSYQDHCKCFEIIIITVHLLLAEYQALSEEMMKGFSNFQAR